MLIDTMGASDKIALSEAPKPEPDQKLQLIPTIRPEVVQVTAAIVKKIQRLLERRGLRPQSAPEELDRSCDN
jgi:hypothetical protein